MDFVIPQLTGTLTPGAHPGSYNGQDVYNDMLFVDTPQAFRKSRRVSSVDDFETWVDDGQTNTLNTFDTGDVRTTHAVVEPIPIQDTRGLDKKQNGLGVGKEGDPSYTLDTASRPGVTDQPAVLMTMREGKDGGGKGPLLSVEQSLTLATGNGQTLFQPTDDEHTQIEGFDPHNHVSTGDLSATIRWGHGVGVGHARVGYGVRRLTPVECERLQSFPDGWTEPAGSDAARYKAMGNAVTVNVVQWILRRIIQNIGEPK
jgi:site-specific DNA-cytosine methylase